MRKDRSQGAGRGASGRRGTVHRGEGNRDHGGKQRQRGEARCRAPQACHCFRSFLGFAAGHEPCPRTSVRVTSKTESVRVMPRRGATFLVLGVLCTLGVVVAASGASAANLAVDRSSAAAGAREGRELARAEGASATALDRREKREEKRLEAELDQPVRGSGADSDALTPSERKADAKVSARGRGERRRTQLWARSPARPGRAPLRLQESKLVDRAERAEVSAERAEKKAEKMLRASGVRFHPGDRGDVCCGLRCLLARRWAGPC